MDSPRDVNVPRMEQVYGHRLSIDNPLLGDNPKVAALRKEREDTNIKVLIDEALRKFFFPRESEEPAEPTEPTEPDQDDQDQDQDEQEAPAKESDQKLSTLVSMFKMLLDTVFSHKMKG